MIAADPHRAIKKLSGGGIGETVGLTLEFRIKITPRWLIKRLFRFQHGAIQHDGLSLVGLLWARRRISLKRPVATP